MATAYKEQAFEEAVESHLLENSWLQGDKHHYDRELAVDPVEFFAFIAETQPDAWQQSRAQVKASFIE